MERSHSEKLEHAINTLAAKTSENKITMYLPGKFLKISGTTFTDE
jgi:hypothetical protein